MTEGYPAHAPTVAAHAARLWTPAPAGPPTDPFTTALAENLARVADPETCAAALTGWRTFRTLSTGQHVCPTHGPRFLAMDRLVTAACPDGVVPIIAACSGIPLNNRANPQQLSFAGPIERVVTPTSRTARRTRDEASARRLRSDGIERRVRLGTNRDRAGLVYGAPTPDSLAAVLADLTPAARALMADPIDDYALWANRTAARIQSRVLGRPVVVIDSNRLVADYLVRAALTPGHPIGRLFSHPDFRARWNALLPGDAWFLARTADDRGHPRFESLRCEGDRLVGPSLTVPIAPDAIAERLADRTLCPGLPLVFGVMAGLEGVRCLGGERQAVYIARYIPAWRALGLPVPPRRGPADVSGLARDDAGRPVYPLDLALDGRRADEVLPDDMPLERLRIGL